MRLRRAIASAAAAALLPLAVHADACFVSSQGIAMVGYDPTSPTALTGAGNLDYSCSASNVGLITVDGGASQNVQARAMTRGAERLAYQLYKDIARTSVWGNDSLTGQVVTMNKKGSVPMYAAIPALQDVTPGTYADTLRVTVTFY